MKKTKDIKFQMRTNDAFMRRLKRAAKLLDKPYAQIVREATNEKLDEIAERFPELERVA